MKGEGEVQRVASGEAARASSWQLYIEVLLAGDR